MSRYWNRTAETTETTGTGALTLAGPSDGMQAIPEGVESTFALEVGPGGADGWEVFRGARTGNTLTRTLIESSTGSTLDLPAGTKTVIHGPAATQYTDPQFQTATLAEHDLGSVSGAVTVPFDTSQHVALTTTGTTDLTLATPAQPGGTCRIRITNPGDHALVWVTSVTWRANTEPTNPTYILMIYDAGSWFGDYLETYDPVGDIASALDAINGEVV